MSAPRCSRCKAELLPGVNFCRQCGSAVTPAVYPPSAELPTTGFDQNLDESPTRRLDVRPTSPNYPARGSSAPPANISGQLVEAAARKRRKPVALILAAIVLLVVGAIAWVGFARHKNQEMMATTNSDALIYPGSQTMVDTVSQDGRAIQLQTDDSLDQVIAWYTSKIKPTKTMRITASTVVLRNQNVTATVVVEDDKTNILIKQAH